MQQGLGHATRPGTCSRPCIQLADERPSSIHPSNSCHTNPFLGWSAAEKLCNAAPSPPTHTHTSPPET
eukprot:360675-Chlamydomonas_euryale.AAC.10